MFKTEPTEMKIVEPKFNKEVPEWAIPIVEILNERIFMGADQLIRFFWPSGNRKGRKILFELSKIGCLRRYEISASEQHLVAYTLGPGGVRHTKRIVPEIDIIKAQELLIANEFCFKNGVAELQFWSNLELSIGEVKIADYKYTLWCPRKIETRMAALTMEFPVSHKGIIAIAPSLKDIYELAEGAKNLTMPIYYTTDNLLTSFMTYKNGNLEAL